MRLRLRFTGLHLFVPIPGPGWESRVHVVMPQSMGHHVPDKHVPLFAVKAGHLASGNTEEGDGWFIHPLRGRVLAIEEGEGADTRICPEIVDLRAVTSLRVDADVLGKNEREKAVARVDLRAGRMSRVERGACWYWASDMPRPYTNSAEWEIPWPWETVTLKLKGWDGTEVYLPTLYPLQGKDYVDVRILHLPASQLPPEEEEIHVPPVMSEVPHFGGYFTLLDGIGPEGRPRFAAEPDNCDYPPNECPKIPQAGASLYNCMLAAGSPPTGE